jgi:hypothetical protein
MLPISGPLRRPHRRPSVRQPPTIAWSSAVATSVHGSGTPGGKPPAATAAADVSSSEPAAEQTRMNERTCILERIAIFSWVQPGDAMLAAQRLHGTDSDGAA